MLAQAQAHINQSGAVESYLMNSGFSFQQQADQMDGRNLGYPSNISAS